MSGICAILQRDGQPLDSGLVEQLVAGLAWRGRDQQGRWAAGPVGLGAVQLWSTPEDWGRAQPVADPGGRRIVLDGRLDNRADLLAALGLPARDGFLLSDAALMLAAYDRWGVGCVERFAGPFAVIIWDAHRQSLFCARDPVGLRTLFYHLSPTRFVAATALRPLRGLPGLSTTLNPDYLWDYLCTPFSGSLQAEETPFRGLSRLPAGTCLYVTAQKVQVECYWKPWELPELVYKRDAEYAEHLRALLGTVVEAHCRSTGPVGATLSGGLDSSSVVCLARQLERRGDFAAPGLHTFTAVWEQSAHGSGAYDELQYVRAVTDQWAGPAHYANCDQATAFDGAFQALAALQDEPFLQFPGLWTQLARLAQAQGVSVLLTGLGGDQLLTGNPFFMADLLSQGRWLTLLRALRCYADQGNSSYARLLMSPLLVAFLPRAIGDWLCRATQAPGLAVTLDTRLYWQIPEWLPNPAQLRRRGAARHTGLRRRFARLATQVDFEQALAGARDGAGLCVDQYCGLPSGVDLRHPFLDRRLVEFSLRLPPTQKTQPSGLTKYVLRRAMAGLLPASIQWRHDKTGYDFVYFHTLRRYWPHLEALLRDSRAAAAGYIDGGKFLEAVRVMSVGGHSLAQYQAFVTLGLEYWLRTLDDAAPGVSAPPPAARVFTMA